MAVMVDTVDTMVANDVMPTLNQKLKLMPTMAANAVMPKLNQKLKPKHTMADMVDMEVMVDTEDMVDTVDTMAASADPLKLKLPQLHTMVVMVHTADMVDMVDTDMVDITEDKPNPHLLKTIT